MKLNSLAFRLFATAAAWTLIALPIVGIIIFSLISDLILENFSNRVRPHVWSLQAEAIEGKGQPAEPKNMIEPLFGVHESGWYWQIKRYDAAQAIYKSASLGTKQLPSPHNNNTGTVLGDMRWLDAQGPFGKPLRIFELVGTIGDGPNAPAYLFTVAGPLEWPLANLNRFAWVLALAFALMGFALLVATLLQVKVALRPLSAVEKGLTDIRTGAAERLIGQFPAEIEPLQVELNALIESNEDIIERARTQVGNLAHALKTPLAVITNEAEQAKTPFAQKVTEQAETMNSQIGHYLDRARMAARAQSMGRATQVLPIAEGLKRALERIHQHKGVQIELNCDEAIAFRGEKQDLEELLGNLLDNASKWASRNVALSVRQHTGAAHTGKWLRIVIEDDGPGVPAAQRQEMVKRGKRLDESKPGSGLGLSIVNDLVTSYRGELQLSKSESGGLRVILILPAVG